MFYSARQYDCTNAISDNKKCKTKEEATDYIMYKLNVDKDSKWFHDNNCDHLWINEKDGKLYHHWRREEYDQYTQLFKKYTDDKPKTIDELKEYIRDGNTLRVFWASRAIVEFSIKPLRTHFHGFSIDYDHIDDVIFKYYGKYDFCYRKNENIMIGHWTNNTKVDLSTLRKNLLEMKVISPKIEETFIETCEAESETLNR